MFEKESGYRMFYLLLALLLCSGCAHEQVQPSRLRSTEPIHYQTSQQATAKSKPIASDLDAEKNFDDDLFENEFEKKTVRIADPLSPVNRAMFHVNDKLYFWVLKPIAKGYKAVTPEFVRIGVKNFLRNIATPIRLVNCLLQGKGNAAAVELSRFYVNTIFGILGFGSPADKYPQLTSPDEEDFGQTLALYGLDNGFYIVWPVFGPSTLRDSIGMAGDWFLDPVNYLEPEETTYAVKGFKKINETSFSIGEYEALKKASVDPYVALRDVYIQYREKKIKD